MATQEVVNRACDAILARGERPTVDRVRTELGGGSPNSLTPLVRAWADARRQLALPTQNSAAAVDPSPHISQWHLVWWRPVRVRFGASAAA